MAGPPIGARVPLGSQPLGTDHRPEIENLAAEQDDRGGEVVPRVSVAVGCDPPSTKTAAAFARIASLLSAPGTS